MLLSRNAFREAVFERDNYRCVMCQKPAADAHHILERRLWPDGGYYVDNGASVCAECHWECERTNYSVEDVREAAGVAKIIPPHLYDDVVYDKWGNPTLPNGQRVRGELMEDESVLKVLADKLDMFTDYVKYPRTYHLPWSEAVTDDDRTLSSLEPFEGLEVVVTEKMDGENTSMYRDHIHARSVDSRSHPSRDWVKNFWSQFAHDIPENWRVCGENLWAKHSIAYDDLESFFMGFSIWNGLTCLAWDETLEYFALLGITPVPTLYRGMWEEHLVRSIELDHDTSEGYVVRPTGPIHLSEFPTKVGKYVRAGHVQTRKHWFYGQPVEQNAVKGV